MNVRVLSVLDDAVVETLGKALDNLTAQAEKLNGKIALDARVNCRTGGTRGVRTWSENED